MIKNARFIDLFAGIGGFRIGFENAGYKCVFSSELNERCQTVYEANFGEKPFGDVTQIDVNSMPDFEVLLGGFPCQPFSICGIKKGFEDTRGTLFFDICRIIDAKQPKVVVLENVKYLLHHDKGNTLKIIIETLEDMGYLVNYSIVNAKDFGVPQNRERLIIVACKGQIKFNFNKIPTKETPKLKDFLDKDGEFEYLDPSEYTLLDNVTIQKTGLIFIGYRNKKIWKRGIRPNTEHLSRVHRQPNRIYSVEGTHPTIPSQESSGRFFIYIPDENRVRKLTLNECYRIMGFPENFKRSESKADQYKQIGNSICIPMVEQIALQIKEQGILESIDYKQEFKRFCKRAEQLSSEEIFYIENKLTDKVAQNKSLKYLIDIIVSNAYKQKGVFTVLTTLLFYKIHNPIQDIRKHQIALAGGFSGRSFDTAYITPVLKELSLPSMAESGWLTRSLEQASMYDLNYKGNISNKAVKEAFLLILDVVQVQGFQSEIVLIYLLYKIAIKAKENDIEIIKLKNPDSLTIDEIIEILDKQFHYNYGESAAAKLPMLAFHAIYQILVKEIKKYEGYSLKDMGSYTASDRTSNTAGDIEIFSSSEQDELVEAIEIKLGITINPNMIRRAKSKILRFRPKRYYIFSTESYIEDRSDVKKLILEIREQHGCQVIINGVIPTIKYYLRLIKDISEFIENYSALIEKDSELKLSHKEYWNKQLEIINATKL